MRHTASLICDYAHVVSVVGQVSLRQAAQKEPACVRGPVLVGGVELYVLDMSTDSLTGTFKDLVAAVTLSYCLERGIQAFVTQSSGNTANAIAAYAHHCGVKATILFMADNISKLKPEFLNFDEIELVGVTGGEPRLKEVTKSEIDRSGLVYLPNLDIQLNANKVRAYFCQDFSEESGIYFDWHAQALSSAYGVFGFYKGIQELATSGRNPKPPKLLGVQQASVAPYVRRFSPSRLNEDSGGSEPIIERTLFRTSPSDDLFDLMADICKEPGAAFEAVTAAGFDRHIEPAVEILKSLSLELARDSDGQWIELSGAIALVGVLQAIERGDIRPGQRVMVAFTGGAGKQNAGRLKEHITIS